jgi:hypothetical protein
MTLENYVKLVPNIETVIRVKEGSFHIEPREIIDSKTKIKKTVNAAAMEVYEENGVPVKKVFSTLSEKLATSLKVAHDNGSLYRYRVSIKSVGSDFAREYQVAFF